MAYRLLAVLASAFVTLQASAQQPASPPTVPIQQIVTSAQGEARTTPDRATIFIGVETRSPTAAQASGENARKQRAVIDTIRALGITNDQFSTVDYSVSPEQVYNPERGDKAPRIINYIVRNTIRVEVRKLEQIGTLLDASLAKGANGINSLNFYASNADDARRTALATAVTRARADADAIAKAMGRCVGEPLELSTGPVARPFAPEAMMARGVAQDATPINPGEQTVTAYVTGRWQIAAVCR
ncbi:MAG: SIMPL domain-containing protein [Gemmatimonadaceae bacterium]